MDLFAVIVTIAIQVSLEFIQPQIADMASGCIAI
jgi:hypothetical protein